MTQSFNALYQTSSSEQAYELALSMIDEVFAAKYCFVGRLSDDGARVRTAAFHGQGNVLANIEYGLEETPCADALQSVDVCIYNEQVADLFPQDTMLRELGIHAYLGVTLRDVARNPIGILVAMFEQPQDFSEQSLQWFQDLAFIVAAQARHDIDIERKNTMLAELSLRNIVFEQSKEAIMITDSENKILRVNPAFELYTGYRESELLGRSPGVLASGRHDQPFYANMWQQLHNHGHWRGEVYNRRKNGEVYPEELSITVNRDDKGEISHYIGLFRDISDWKESERQLRFFANQEPLTGLHNRRSFLERVEQHIDLFNEQRTLSSLLFLNLDRFKDINDLYGPEVGDRVLVAVALRLQHCVLSSDVLSRYGGDEFTLLLANSSPQQAYACAQRILTHICQPIRLGELNIELTCSLGIAHIDNNTKSATVFVRNANHAMLSAKRAQSQSIVIYSDEIEGQYLRKIQLRDKLAKALKANELSVAYQPIISLRSGKITKFEALARWHDEELGTIYPDEFIAIAEEFGLISVLGQFVLKRALNDLATLHKRGYRHIGVSVNRSASEFNHLLQPVEAILAALHEHQIATHQLTIEVTESVAIGAQKQVQDQLNELRDKGVKVALDDFCTGYSSLSHLIDLRADYLKIDKSFTQQLLGEHKHQVVIASLIKIASELDMEVIAEGVECEEQHQQLRDYGCHFSQGFYYSEPVSLAQALILLEQADSLTSPLEVSH
ncbi:bifunctional diguanylate cyclase/phosphodiesterase [Pseudoalteromonas sp. T1lg75]|uniref:bifunctional diguanylate cyclase/phosphodiesterase n=1 Tax=Pseudoalteromonas sp. T1lg75 TaxID=2077102 RepID=UPI000CF6465F|nr:EAL domain-containing protein [Pseudoalteromonas sp. T1lg75]